MREGATPQTAKGFIYHQHMACRTVGRFVWPAIQRRNGKACEGLIRNGSGRVSSRKGLLGSDSLR